MKYFLLSKKLTIFSLIFFLFSCASRKDIVYYQNSDTITDTDLSDFEIKIQPDDLLSITVTAEDVESAVPFNLSSSASGQGIGVSGSTYLVDINGDINFPIIGQIHIGGKSKSELIKMFQDKIEVYIKKPIINIRLINFKISVQGEVNAPGIYEVVSERITLVEAISKAKDLTIYGKRKNILILRENNGKKTFNRVDITRSDFMNSPFYYLQQNDVVYVEPNKNKINGAAVGPSTGMIFSVTSLVIAVITLIIRL